MQEGVTRQQVEKLIVDNINIIMHDKKKVKHLKNAMDRHNVTPGMLQKYLINIESDVEDMDLSLLVIFISQLYKLNEDYKLNPDLYFTLEERKQANFYTYVDLNEFKPLEFPITVDNVLQIDEDMYVTKWSAKFIKRLMDSALLLYNPDTQREGRFVKRHDTIEIEPKIYQDSVDEIRDRALGQSKYGNLSSTTLIFNATVGSAESGSELIYNSHMQLVFTKGTILNIIDGMHRILGTTNALDSTPDFDFTFIVVITNYTTSRARKYLAEISKVNKVNETFIQALEEVRYSDIIVKHLMAESDLKQRVSLTNRIHSVNNELCSYNILADTIEEEFDIKSKKEAMDVGEYLVKFFDYLIGSFPSEFIDNVQEIKKTSLINSNIMFAGYVTLAKKMMVENIEIDQLVNILNNIDFSRDNSEWKELNIIDDTKITRNSQKYIKEYFKNIQLMEGLMIG